MSDKLSPMDRSSLVAEHGPVNMTIGSLIFVERGPGTTFDAIVTRLREPVGQGHPYLVAIRAHRDADGTAADVEA